MIILAGFLLEQVVRTANNYLTKVVNPATLRRRYQTSSIARYLRESELPKKKKEMLHTLFSSGLKVRCLTN